MQVGEKIKSRNLLTGQDEAKTVTATIKCLAPAVVTVSMTDAKTGRSETLTCTPEHPFFVSGQGWVEAGSLGIGTSLVSRAGPALSVTNITWQRNRGSEKAEGTGSSVSGYVVYNLTVEDDHTFFVGTAGGGTWVHNSWPCVIGLSTDVEEFHGDSNYNTLNVPNWSPQLQEQWISRAYDSGEDIIMQTPIEDFGPGEGEWTLHELQVLHTMPDGGIELGDVIDQIEGQTGFSIGNMSY